MTENRVQMTENRVQITDNREQRTEYNNRVPVILERSEPTVDARRG